MQLQNAAHLKKMIEEYDDQRTEVLKEASVKFHAIEEGYKNQYNESMKQIESEQQELALESAEESLENIQ